MAYWTLTYGPGNIVADAGVLGVSKLTRRRQSAKTDLVTFEIPGLHVVDAAPFFPQWSQVSVSANGQRWFTGIVTKITSKGSGREESTRYEISGPWYWLEKIVFQQQWVVGDLSGGAEVTQTTTQSDVILGQSLDLTKMNSGQVMAEVLYYAQYAYQGVPFPTSVGPDHLPPQPNQRGGPFQIGSITPSITVPYSQVRDKTCADLVKLMMKYSPDAVAWFDYLTSPPTLNISQRSRLNGTAVSVLGGTAVSEFNPTPRYDLQVPAVIAKFQSNDTIDGTSYLVTHVDKYPPNVADNAPRAWVQTIDLEGGSISYEKQTVSVTSRPDNTATAAQALAWVTRHNTLIAPQGFTQANLATSSGAPGIYVLGVQTTVDPNDPALNDPFNMPADGSGYLSELLAGAVTPWMYDQEGFLAADATIETYFQYTGTDPILMGYFASQPAIPASTLFPNGFPAGMVVVVPVRCKITNAGGISGFTTSTVTEEYTTVASKQTAEPVPTGFSQALYTALAELHYEGDLTFIEQECTDPLPIGCVFNTNDGNAGWQHMNALVLGVDEDIDNGTTRVRFGPPLMQGLQELEELFRSNLGRLPSYQLQQRGSGKTADASPTIQGSSQSAASSSHLPPGGGAQGAWNWKVYNTTNAMAAQVQINGGDGFVAQLNGTVCNVNGATTSVATGMPPVYPQLAITGNGWVYAKVMLDPVSAAITALDAYFASSLPSYPTPPPYSFFIMPLAQIVNYTSSSGSSSSPSFQVLNVYSGYGPSTLLICLGRLSVY